MLRETGHDHAHVILDIAARSGPMAAVTFMERLIIMGFTAGVHQGLVTAVVYPERAMALRDTINDGINADMPVEATNALNDYARQLVEALDA